MTMLESISVTVAIISLLVSLVAARIAKSSLVQARLVSDRDRRDWRQRKWFDLYFKANEAYDSLERFQGQYDSTSDESVEFKADFNAVMSQIRSVHAAAVVFPKDPALDELFSATAVFKARDEVFSKERLRKIFNAVEGIRKKALVDADILG